MPAYTEPIKNSARKAVITAAVEALTKYRTNSTLTRRSYVREVRSHLLQNGTSVDKKHAGLLSDDSLNRWESFYDTLVQSKAPGNLRIAYLSGPNPENDLRVFCDAGILPENIWAFESSNSVYSNAVTAALASEFPFIKLVNGGIDNFIESTPQRFDIIYLDFCGPLPSRNKKQKTLTAITKILKQHALTSPGALITNVALPTIEQDTVGRGLLAKLVASYLYPKSFLESDGANTTITEGPVAKALNPDDWLDKVEEDLGNYYGQFVTRLLIDHATFISPYDRFPKKSKFFENLFSISDASSFKSKTSSLFHTDHDGNGGDVIADPGCWPILWTLGALVPEFNLRDSNYPQWINSDEDFKKFAELFCNQLSSSSKAADLSESLINMSFLLSEGSDQKQFWSESLRRVGALHHIGKYYQFCDLVLFHQITELLFRQLAFPYHVNVAATRRWNYVAKETPMYLDMLILDECRYLYDWMPTTDMIAAGMNDIERQLAYRFALDGIAKHRRWYNTELLNGTAVIDQFTEPFEAKLLEARKTIK